LLYCSLLGLIMWYRKNPIVFHPIKFLLGHLSGLPVFSVWVFWALVLAVVVGVLKRSSFKGRVFPQIIYNAGWDARGLETL